MEVLTTQNHCLSTFPRQKKPSIFGGSQQLPLGFSPWLRQGLLLDRPGALVVTSLEGGMGRLGSLGLDQAKTMDLTMRTWDNDGETC